MIRQSVNFMKLHQLMAKFYALRPGRQTANRVVGVLLGLAMAFTQASAQTVSVSSTGGSGVIGGQASATFTFNFDFSLVNPFQLDAADLRIEFDGNMLALNTADSSIRLFGDVLSLSGLSGLAGATVDEGLGFFDLSFVAPTTVEIDSNRQLLLVFDILATATPGITTVIIPDAQICNGSLVTCSFLNDESIGGSADIAIRRVAAVPEPSSLPLLGLGLFAVMAAKRMRGKA